MPKPKVLRPLLLILLAWLAVTAVSCTSSVPPLTPQPSASARLIPTARPTEPDATLIPATNFGLYVEMIDRNTGTGVWSGTIERRKGNVDFWRRVYNFDRGEPVVVMATVLVFGPGELSTANCSFQEFKLSIVNQQGQVIGDESDFAGSRQCIVGIGVDRITPQTRTFRIDEEVDLSAGGPFTLTLAQWVWTNEGRQLVEGNPVRFWVQEP